MTDIVFAMPDTSELDQRDKDQPFAIRLHFGQVLKDLLAVGCERLIDQDEPVTHPAEDG
jgi:hypothetical protein